MSTYSATCQTTTMTCSLTSPPKRRVMFRRMNSSPCLGTNDLNDSQEETNTSLENNEKDGQHSKITSSPRPIMKNSLSGSALQDNADEDDLSNKPSPRNKKILKRKVSFGHIKIREHPRALGDHPSVSSGPALSLGWYSEDGKCKYSRTTELPLEAYEQQRGSPRSRREIIVPRHERQRILLEEAGMTFSELEAFQHETELLKRSRKNAAKCPEAIRLQQGGEVESPPVLKALQRMSRQLLRLHHKEHQTHSAEQKQLDQLMARAEAAEKVRQQHMVSYWMEQGAKSKEEPCTSKTDHTPNPNVLRHAASEPFFLPLLAGMGESSEGSEPLDF